MIRNLRLITLFVDYLLVITAFMLAYWARVGMIDSTDFPFTPYMWSAVITGLVWVGVLMVLRGYSRQQRLTETNQLIKVLLAGLTGSALFIGVFYFAEKVVFSRLLLVYSSVFGISLMLIFHVLMTLFEKKLIKQGTGVTRALIIGSNRGVKRFINKLKKNTSPYIPVAILDGYGTKLEEISGVPVLGKLNLLEKVVDEHQIDVIVQGDNIEQVLNISSFCKKNALDHYILPYLLGVYQDNVDIVTIEQSLIYTPFSNSRHWVDRFIG
ncbi:MAG: hypothetical protein P1V18_01990 [Candidatus Gracilibacteria bacterium]|nr:hypothetical protein [Candidatus Gracilibacteria bacterium]